ncbi:hypothetical protein CDAR_43721 [Caerostris darwini]|uniref:Uncharacterized protein n=1 Tax=Caerostris darwini TaxID=1538125 RepID=A0AAV4WI47_9ARAC|nr:hypothetical protein CDAR_43721 [Caerostris darwini]
MCLPSPKQYCLQASFESVSIKPDVGVKRVSVTCPLRVVSDDYNLENFYFIQLIDWQEVGIELSTRKKGAITRVAFFLLTAGIGFKKLHPFPS